MRHYPARAATRFRFIMECDICCEDKHLEDFVYCKNRHPLCTSCFPRVRSCPMCRARIVDFTDSNGERVEVPCRNREMGCDGDHEGPICPYELFHHLSPIQHRYLFFIINGLFEFDNPLFVWGEAAYPVLVSLRHSFRLHMDLWEGFIPYPELLQEVYDVIYGIH